MHYIRFTEAEVWTYRGNLPNFTHQVNCRNRIQAVDYVCIAHAHYTFRSSKIDPTSQPHAHVKCHQDKKKIPIVHFFSYSLFPPPKKVNNGKTHDISTTDYCVSPFS